MNTPSAVPPPRTTPSWRGMFWEMFWQLAVFLLLFLFPATWVAVGFPLAMLIWLGILAIVFWPRRKVGGR